MGCLSSLPNLGPKARRSRLCGVADAWLCAQDGRSRSTRGRERGRRRRCNQLENFPIRQRRKPVSMSRTVAATKREIYLWRADATTETRISLQPRRTTRSAPAADRLPFGVHRAYAGERSSTSSGLFLCARSLRACSSPFLPFSTSRWRLIPTMIPARLPCVRSRLLALPHLIHRSVLRPLLSSTGGFYVVEGKKCDGVPSCINHSALVHNRDRYCSGSSCVLRPRVRGGSIQILSHALVTS
ncbi:hypothetical protein EXIGLDRAFT_298151 [Exidia glandulosa HHB12029]|uniref:Uncharacterized protein n=1 Tax=Exidia glandulosa HHB12029 TaxID=1314781 RepID=A0A165LYZ8_EXIGL|nr:hypothetical protein EXIGLDRAFT_298151 [Exidia glandulosa HHB12029]